MKLKFETPVAPASLPETCDVLKILPLSDLHLKAKPAATELLVANEEYLARMDFVQLLGDQVATYGTHDEYAHLQNFVRRLPRPYGAINGNHEFYFQVHDEDSGNNGRLWNEASVEEKQSQLDKFKTFFGYETLWRAEKNHLGTFVFLGLDNVAQTKPETLSTPQLAFLAAQLLEAQDEPVYVFCHAPLYLDTRLDLTYYDDERTACVELGGVLRELLESRRAPLFWMSGHIHLRPDHYLFAPYQIKPNVWQIHCPDSWGYSRWAREHITPQRHEGLFSRHLEIERERVTFVSHDHIARRDLEQHIVEFDKILAR
jgi:3',5'-cyclic AMP phosphodiesterase CpdA